MKLFITVLFGLIIPWTIGALIFKKDKGVIAIIAPFSCVIAFAFNTIGISLGYFSPQVSNIDPYIITIITNIGIFSIEPCILIFAVRHTSIRPIYLLVLVTVFASLFDLVLLALNLLNYAKGWNIVWSVIWFFASFYIVYYYYLLLKRLNLLQ